MIRRKRRFSTDKGKIGNITHNVLKRDFKTDKPNQKWATDVTEFKIVDTQGNTKKLYLSPIIDLFNGEVVSYCPKDRSIYPLVDEMLKDALTKFKADEAPILHSNQRVSKVH